MATRGMPVGWKKLGRAQYFAFPHHIYPWDQRLVKRFRAEVDPTFVPLWVRNIYRHPAGATFVFDRNVLATSCCDNASSVTIEREFQQNIIGVDTRRFRPHTILDILEGPEHTAYEPGLPGGYVEFDMAQFLRWKEKAWWAQKWAKEDSENREDQASTYLESRRNQISAIDDKWRAESDYRWDHDWRYMTNLQQKMTREEQVQAAAHDAWARQRVYH